jgi:hypothetical protein
MSEIQKPEVTGGSGVNYADLFREAQLRGEATPNKIIDPERAHDLALTIDKFMPMSPPDSSLDDAAYSKMQEKIRQAHKDEHADRAQVLLDEREGLYSLED